MFSAMFDELGDDPRFQKMIKETVKNMVMRVNNDLKFKELEVDDDVVKATLLICINEDYCFEFLKTINLVVNGEDETAFGNVAEFLNKLETIYIEADLMKEDYATKKYGGI